jgi:hypothetical protein
LVVAICACCRSWRLWEVLVKSRKHFCLYCEAHGDLDLFHVVTGGDRCRMCTCNSSASCTHSSVLLMHWSWGGKRLFWSMNYSAIIPSAIKCNRPNITGLSSWRICKSPLLIWCRW